MVRAYCLPGPWRSVRASASGSAAAGSKAYSLTVVPMKAARSVSQRDHQPWPGRPRIRVLKSSSAVVSRSNGAAKAGSGRPSMILKPSGDAPEALEQGSRLECVAQ